MIKSEHQQHLLAALSLAAIKQGECAPNPAVGAIVVKNGQVIAEGYHEGAGFPHAEVNALAKLTNAEAQGATIYITLEPCCHHGRTPPCTELLIKRQLAAVYYGFRDPDPRVAGKGEVLLQQAGIRCQQIELTEINQFYHSYTYWHQTHKPWITVKLAVSVDGKVAGPAATRCQITASKINDFTHLKRKQTDAILTTAKTIIADDPQLNARLPNKVYNKPIFIMDRQLVVPASATIWQTSSKAIVFHQTTKALTKQQVETNNKRYYSIACEQHGLDLQEIITFIGNEGKHDLWVEAGPTLFHALVKNSLANTVYLYIGSKILGSNAYSANLENLPELFQPAQNISWRSFEQDVLCEVNY